MLLGTLAAANSLAEEVNVYSARQEALIKPLLDKFTAATGITANLVTAKADELLERLQAEGDNTPADVFLTVDAGNLNRAKAAGVLQPIESAVLTQAIPAHLRDHEGYWYGLSYRTRPIMYSAERVDPSELSTYEALADEKWKSRICVRSSDNVYNQSLVAAFIAHLGEAATEAWLEGFVSNFARDPQGGDRDQIKAVAAGECDVALANNYYLAQMLYASEDPAEKEAAQKVTIFWPDQAGRGVHVNVSGAGVVKSAKHKENATKLLEFLAGDEAQQWYAEVNYEYPVKAGVSWGTAVNGFGEFKADTLSLDRLGDNNALAVKLMDRVGWK
jgi:iron(III) transport system substrate-binding protein